MKYLIVTYGCQMNIHESEKLAGILENNNYTLAENQKDADVIVFNTCAIREGAEDRAFGNIGALKKMKAENPNKLICVCGCMSQQEEVAKKLYDTFPFIDIIFGTNNLFKFEELLKQKIEKKKRICEITQVEYVDEGTPMLRSSGDNAWVNIMYGCNNFCTYCIVPYVRGRERSRKKEDIISEIQDVVKEGKYKKITLLGQNVNSYGKDLYDDYAFADLLKEICKIDGEFKFTFMTSHPKDINDDVIETLAKENKILKELHLPIQSGSNKILKAMNRNYTVESYKEKVEKLKNLIPKIRLSTDIIVGFPGETDEDFNETVKLIEEVEYNGIFAFMYSKRSGTVAEKMPDQVDEKIKNYRVNYILNLQKKIEHKGE